MKKTLFLVIMSLAMHANAGGGSSVGPENPASADCETLGGRWSILEDEEKNQWGFCTFDQALIEEWTLFRHRNGEKTMAVIAFLAQPHAIRASEKVANPATELCHRMGGVTRNWTGSVGYPTNEAVDLCQFPDRSVIGTWTLFYGPKQNPFLARILEEII